MKILNILIKTATARRLKQIDYFRKNPEEVQHNTLKNLVETAEKTKYGRTYKFSSFVRNNKIDIFKKNVPISTYEDIQSSIEQIRNNKTNILWPGAVKWFAISSGTTSDKSKFIPVSKAALEYCHFRGGRDLIAIYSDLFPENKIFQGRVLAVGGSRQITSYNNEQYYGDLSAVLMENLPFWAKLLRTPDKATALMPEWEEKLEKMASKTMKSNVTNISGVPSWTLVLLKKIMELSGRNNIIDVWPNLELFVHGGVSFTPYREEFKKIIKKEDMNYMETYNASEGFFAIQDDLTKDDMLLMLDYGIFYEFVPFEKVFDKNPETVTIEDVELDKNYALIISTNGGLWRYMIGDTIKFTSKYPFKIKITGRVKHFINAFGEELIIDNAETALKKACDKTKAVIKEYSAAPIFMNQNKTGGHEWMIEFSYLPDNVNLFVETLDNSLKEVNSDYEAKRHKNLALKKPVLHIAKSGVFYNWMKLKKKLGGQNKVPRLSNTREYMEELLEINKSL